MMFFRHVGVLLVNLCGYARQHKAWWLMPLIGALLIMALVVATVEVATPFIYTLF